MSRVIKDNFGYDIHLEITVNQISVDLSSADVINFRAVSNTRKDTIIEGTATYDSIEEIYKYTVKETDFVVVDSWNIYLDFKWLSGEDVTKLITCPFGVLKVE